MNNSIKLIILVLLLVILDGVFCNRVMDPPAADNQTEPVEEQNQYIKTIELGQYVVLRDTTKGMVGGQKLTYYDWRQDEANPEKIHLYPGYGDSVKTVGLRFEGVYKFSLYLKAEEIDTTAYLVGYWEITVQLTKKKLIPDPSLEMWIRQTLGLNNEELTEKMLLSLDSMRANPWYYGMIRKLDGIEKCKNLRILSLLLQKELTSLEPLATLTKLEYLQVDQTHNLVDVTPLKKLINLKHLDLNTNKIKDISSLKDLKNLQYLDIGFNAIIDISVLENCSRLKTAYIGANQISDISAFSNLFEIETLYLGIGKVKDISALSNHSNLEVISFFANQIEDISVLSTCTNLKRIDFDHNNITDISALESLEQLARIRFCGNNISDISPLVRNKGLGKGDLLSLLDNPLNEISQTQYIPELQARGVAVSWDGE